MKKQMSFDEFVERAHRIVPMDYTVFCGINKARYFYAPNENENTIYTVLLMRDAARFESNCPKKTLSKLKNYFDTL